MKKTKFIYSFLSLFLLAGCESANVKKNALVITDDYKTVCEDATFSLNSRTNVNVLPIGYHGAYPDTGIYEIGGYCGDSFSSKAKPFDLGITNSSGQAVSFTIAFSSNPLSFPINNAFIPLGFEVSIKTNSGNDEFIDRTIKAFKLSEIFNKSASGYYLMGSVGRTSGYIYTPANIMGININLYPGEKVNYVRFIYGEIPHDVINASIFLQAGDDLSIGGLASYSGSDCSRTQYTKNIGSNAEYNLISQYGTVYSKDYLMSKFIVKDDYDDINEHVSEYLDPDDYFNTGYKAAIGTKFDVTFYKDDSSGNRGTIVFHFTVKDKLAPVITKIKDEKLQVSYTTVFDNDFIYKNFYVIDNLDNDNCKVTLTDIDGNVISNNLGNKSLLLTAEDSSGNVSKYEFEVELIDDIPPVINCKHDELTLSPTNVITSQSLLNMFECVDEIDGEIKLSIKENTYSENASTMGQYVFTVSASDNSGNYSEKSIDIYVSDLDAPIFFAKQSFLTFAQGQVPDENVIIQSLIRQEVLPDKNYVSSELVEGYEITNDLEVGEYYSTIQYFADDNSSEIADLTIEIVEKKNLGVYDAIESVDDLEEEELSFWAKFCKFWIDLWNSIVSFFTGN